jgi:hypothetical protein
MEVGNRLWRYLSERAAPSDLSAVAESLFALPRNELGRLTAAHLGASASTAAMLAAVPRVLRELPSSVERAETTMRTAVRPPIQWQRTMQKQFLTGDSQSYVCRPPERAYDTSLGRLVLLALNRCASLPERGSLRGKGVLGSEVAGRAAEAERLRRHAKLREVTEVATMPERALVSLRRHRHAAPVVAWVRESSEALEARAPRVIREVIQERLLLPSQASRLFELFVGFCLVDAFVAAGFAEAQQRLIPNKKVPFARLRRGAEELDIYWQRPLWAVEGSGGSGRWATALDDAGMANGQLRPDFVIKVSNPGRLAFVEVKLTEAKEGTRDRSGLQDAFAYAFDAESLLAPYPEPHGLVVAWNAEGRPGPGRFVVASQDAIPAAVQAMLAQWPPADGP